MTTTHPKTAASRYQLNSSGINEIEKILVTVKIAYDWLEHHNTHNRPLNQARIDSYASDMTEGRWCFNGETIQFDQGGVLLNGQHRLWAIIQSQCPQWFVVVRNLTPASQLTMDQGTRRAPADQLALTGWQTSKTIPAAIRIYITWTTGRFFGDLVRKKINTTEVVQWAQDHPEEMNVLLECEAAARKVPSPPGSALAVSLQLHQLDWNTADEFYAGLASGAELEARSPILTLRNRLLQHQERQIEVSKKETVGLFVMAWNAYRDGRTLAKLQRPSGGWSKDTFPRPR